jgi:Uma2 family endonuclease
MLRAGMAIESMPAAAPAVAAAGPELGRWAYEDYLKLPNDGKRYEVIDGWLYVAPAPSPRHQQRLGNLVAKVIPFVRETHLGSVYFAPIDVLMPGASPVQPDTLFLANDNPAEIDMDRYIRGVPDLVIEVASPSTVGYDRREKQDLYARAGVREYWVVPQSEVAIEVLSLDPERRAYRSLGIFLASSHLPSDVLGELPFTVSELLE